MEYFTKWLPVEGEIKEGYMLDTLKNEVIYYNGDYGEKRPETLKSVKLFLCTMEIRLEDENVQHVELGPVYLGYYSKRTNKWDVKRALDYEEDEEYSVDPSDLFKVIGEVSETNLIELNK